MNGILGLRLAIIEVIDASLAEKKFNEWSAARPDCAVYEVKLKNHPNGCMALYIFYKPV